jgi:hypothetical protein
MSLPRALARFVGLPARGPMAGRVPEEASCGEGAELRVSMPDDGIGGEVALQSPLPLFLELPRPPFARWA